MEELWNKLDSVANFYERKDYIQKFNERSRWKKKGLSVIPTAFGSN